MIEIERTGALNTVQDLGRTAFRHLGVSVSGVMDPLALRAGNLLLGNDENAAAIEVQVFPMRVHFLQDTAIAITGADCRALLDGIELPPWWGCRVKKGQRLELRYPRSGTRGYLCIAGGIEVPAVLGSRSTALRGSFGGFHGRTLAAGDRLPLGMPDRVMLPDEGVGMVPPSIALQNVFPPAEHGVTPVRAIPSGEYALFAADHHRFWQQPWAISLQSNRTGYRLSGAPIFPSQAIEMRSYGLIPGIVQVPPAGEPIIQLSDANTAGGYPKIACVIEEDLWRLGQLQAGQSIQLIKSDANQALAARQAIDGWLQRLRDVTASFNRVSA
ncbi:biotin-dependent carboxyltransferase family protein [Kosakonia sp. BK9b]|uniref:5-oxoprolinase subunit C family protein n=1 Tax=Kosakonia sp. TaxID=1916651 RepID=UPI0028965F5C|nr:biotin-dependent carboxyltransferase family protein [Kosakonia sp.]